MVTVVIQGGLGNQLFQYAYGRALLELGNEVIFDVSFFDTNTKYTKRKYMLGSFLLRKTIATTSKGYAQKFLTRCINKIDVDRKIRYVPIKKSNDAYIADGYYNTEKYFVHIRDIILSEVVLLEESEKYKEWAEKIRSAHAPIILHARKTDYTGSGFANLSERYYEEALTHFDEECPVFAFSDDISWLQKTLKRPITIVSGNGLTDYEELMLMSLGTNFIIANSTFSWWGAWLSQVKGKKVVAPKQWFTSKWWHRANRDVVPESWTRI